MRTLLIALAVVAVVVFIGWEAYRIWRDGW